MRTADGFGGRASAKTTKMTRFPKLVCESCVLVRPPLTMSICDIAVEKYRIQCVRTLYERFFFFYPIRDFFRLRHAYLRTRSSLEYGSTGCVFTVVDIFLCVQVVDRNRALTQELQRERAERQRVQARLVAAERGAEGAEAESLTDTVAALEV